MNEQPPRIRAAHPHRILPLLPKINLLSSHQPVPRDREGTIVLTAQPAVQTVNKRLPRVLIQRAQSTDLAPGRYQHIHLPNRQRDIERRFVHIADRNAETPLHPIAARIAAAHSHRIPRSALIIDRCVRQKLATGDTEQPIVRAPRPSDEAVSEEIPQQRITGTETANLRANRQILHHTLVREREVRRWMRDPISIPAPDPPANPGLNHRKILPAHT